MQKQILFAFCRGEEIKDTIYLQKEKPVPLIFRDRSDDISGKELFFHFHDAHVDWAGDIPAAITKCNQAIFDLGGEDENNAEQEALIAPALAMRAFYHFIFMAVRFAGWLRRNMLIFW